MPLVPQAFPAYCRVRSVLRQKVLRGGTESGRMEDEMQHDRQITITTGASRKTTHWQAQTLMLSELYARIATPARSTDTMADYLSLPKGQQDELKDVGGFVAGTLTGTRRKAGAVSGRDVLTLDLDNIPAGGTDDVLRRVEALGCGYGIYSTRKHCAAAPRLRVLLPLDRTCTADEYEPCARRMADMIGMTLADPTTFEASRLMYWPSVCADAPYVYRWADKPMLSVDGLLATYADWHDSTAWPASPGAVSPRRLAAKQGDPETKGGVVGAFCRVYDVEAAIEAYLPGVYEPVDGMEDRLTYTGGSTTGGAVLYDDGKFLYSHHATDPAGGRLVNAFDLVRLHKFGDEDDAAEAGTPTIRLPSYTAMCALAAADDKVSHLLLSERRAEATAGFTAVPQEAEPEDDAWLSLLDLHPKTGAVQPTVDNVRLILEHDPLLARRFALNRFAGRVEVRGPLPWQERAERRLWSDTDNEGLYWYIEKAYGLYSRSKVDGAWAMCCDANAFNEVADYLDGLTWDGVPRLDTLFIDYLGAEDTAYTRAVTRKAFVAAVARAKVPGTKYDCMTILVGPQGVGKSTILDKMSKGWFCDSVRTFEGKEASELIQGVWLVEVGELDAFRRSDVTRIKQFLSQRVDRFRAAYGRHVKELPRTCVFFGTTNNYGFLTDETGNRRFYPVDVGERAPTKDIWSDLDGEVDQVWAEARACWDRGEALQIPPELTPVAKAVQDAHLEEVIQTGVIADFLAKPVPEDWAKWDLDQRRVFWAGGAVADLPLVDRGRVCALEVWCELYGRAAADIRNADAHTINRAIAAIPGWAKPRKVLKYGKPYGSQRGWLRTEETG